MKYMPQFALTTLAVCVSLVTSGFGQDIFEKDKGLYETAQITNTIAIGPQNKLIIKSAESLSGSLTITSAKVKQITVKSTKSAKTGSRSQAIDYIDLITVSLDKQGEMTRLELRAPNPSPWNEDAEAGMVDAQIVVPEKCALDIDAGRFAVEATGPFAAVVISSSLERVSVQNVNGLVDISTANQPVILKQARGEIAVATTNAPINASEIRVDGTPARFRNDGGETVLDDVFGAVNIRADYGRIDVRRFNPATGNSVIRGTGAPVLLQIDSMSDGQLVVSNSDEDIDLTVPESISAFFSLSVDPDGSIEARGMPFKTDLVQPTRLNIRTGESDANIRGTVSGKGSIFIRGTRGE